MALSRRLGGLPLALHHAGSYLDSPFTAEQSFATYRMQNRICARLCVSWAPDVS
jgi:hypothetical protein